MAWKITKNGMLLCYILIIILHYKYYNNTRTNRICHSCMSEHQQMTARRWLSQQCSPLSRCASDKYDDRRNGDGRICQFKHQPKKCWHISASLSHSLRWLRQGCLEWRVNTITCLHFLMEGVQCIFFVSSILNVCSLFIHGLNMCSLLLHLLLNLVCIRCKPNTMHHSSHKWHRFIYANQVKLCVCVCWCTGW